MLKGKKTRCTNLRRTIFFGWIFTLILQKVSKFIYGHFIITNAAIALNATDDLGNRKPVLCKNTGNFYVTVCVCAYRASVMLWVVLDFQPERTWVQIPVHQWGSVDGIWLVIYTLKEYCGNKIR